MMKAKKISRLLALILICATVFTFAGSAVASAASYPWAYLPVSYTNEDYYVGEEIALKFTYFPKYHYEQQIVDIYNSSGSKVGTCSFDFTNSDGTFVRYYTVTWNTANKTPDRYKIVITSKFYSLYEWHTSPTTDTAYITLKSADQKKADKPVITTQPASKKVVDGKDAVFTVAASGPNLKYQWQYRKNSSDSWKKSSFEGAETASMTVPATISRDGYQYRCKVYNKAGTTYSKAATLTVTMAKPSITTQPKNTTAAPGETANFKVVASGSSLSYQWYFRKTESGSWTKCSGATAASYEVEAKSYRNGYQYRCAVSNAAGTVYSNAVTLNVVAKPKITGQPASVSTTVGKTVQFTVSATGTDLKYQWYFCKPGEDTWQKSSNGTAATLSVEAKSYRDGYQYRCEVKNSGGSVTSQAALLTVLAKPTIVGQPANCSCSTGDTAYFYVEAEGTGLSYQWYFCKPGESTWQKCSGGTSSSLAVEAKAYRNGYQYRCKVTNEAGSVNSTAAYLYVN